MTGVCASFIIPCFCVQILRSVHYLPTEAQIYYDTARDGWLAWAVGTVSVTDKMTLTWSLKPPCSKLAYNYAK